jgi:hypothetical protein
MKSNIVSSCCQANVLFTLNEHDLPSKTYCSKCFKPCLVEVFDFLGKPNEREHGELFNDNER